MSTLTRSEPRTAPVVALACVLLLLLAEHTGRWAHERRPQEVSRHPPHNLLLLLLLLLLLAVVVVVVETALLLLLEVVVVEEPMLFLLQLVLLILLAVVRLLRLRVARGSRRCEMRRNRTSLHKKR